MFNYISNYLSKYVYFRLTNIKLHHRHFKLSQLTHLTADVVCCQLSITHKLYVINYLRNDSYFGAVHADSRARPICMNRTKIRFIPYIYIFV